MPNSADFIAHLLELMHGVAEGRARRTVARAMFGGHGVYVDGTIVAIVIDDILYFKTDDVNRGEFAALGLEPFEYVSRAGTKTVMSYHRAPDEALESPVAMAQWLRSATGAALRSAKSTPRRARLPTSAPSKPGFKGKPVRRTGPR